MTAAQQPDGLVALFLDERGAVIAHVADFNRSGYGGFSLREAQEVRVKQALCWAVMHAYASPQLVRGLSEYHASETVRTLCRQHGCKVQIIAIGHKDEAP